MAIFYAIGKLIELVKNMAKKHTEQNDDNGNDTTPKYPQDKSQSQDQQEKCTNTNQNKSSSTTAQEYDSDEEEDDDEEEDGDPNIDDNDIGIGNILPSINLNSDEDDNDEENEPGKSFLEILFGFILDPITAIIKGIINTIKLVIVTINVATHLKQCAKWFVIYVICTLLYLPISMLFALLNLSNFEKKIWKILNSIDAAIFCLTEKVRGPGKGFHIVKYNDSIREICFLETVVPTNCAAPVEKTAPKKNVSMSKLLGPYLFLIVTIFFMCFFIFKFGRYSEISKDNTTSTLSNVNEIPFTFLLLLSIVVFTTVCLIVSAFTSTFIYIFILSIFPITLFLFSFLFHLFTFFYDFDEMEINEYNNIFKISKISTWKTKFIFKFLAGFFITLFGFFLQLPFLFQCIVGIISIFIMLIVIVIIIYLIIPTEYVKKIPPGFFRTVGNIINKAAGKKKPKKSKKPKKPKNNNKKK
jgi:hypothetical protein